MKDGRTKPLSERKVRKTYRLLPEVAEGIQNAALLKHTTETAIIEELVTNYLMEVGS